MVRYFPYERYAASLDQAAVTEMAVALLHPRNERPLRQKERLLLRSLARGEKEAVELASL